jgi:hypothetical protein
MDMDHPQEPFKEGKERLTVEEEKVLVKRYCKTIVIAFGKWLGELSGVGHEVENWVVKWSAATLFRRYYVYHTLSDISPKEIMMGCMLLAAKIEECRLFNAEALHIWRERNYSVSQIVEAESTVAAGVTFDLNIFSPSIALSGIFELLTSKANELTSLKPCPPERAQELEHAQAALKYLAEKQSRADILKDLELLMYSDALFLYPPAMLALAAAAKGPLKDPIKILLNLQPDSSISPHFEDKAVPNEEFKRLETKLELTRNPLYNRDSDVYKAKLQAKQTEYAKKQDLKNEKMAHERADTLQSLGVTPLPNPTPMDTS